MKLAFVTPRYGAEIGSGPEHACRLIAEQLADRHDVDVLTTCARDPFTWANDYSEGPDRVRGVLVRRFATNQMHDRVGFGELCGKVFSGTPARQDEVEWVRRLGPSAPGLIDYLKRQQRHYDALVFFSLLHQTTLLGVSVAAERSVLFPYLQVHPALRFSLWRDVLRNVRAFAYLSASERPLTRAFLRITPAAEEITGIGVDPLPQQSYPRHQQDPADNPIADSEELGPAGGESDEAGEPDHLAARGTPFRRRHRLHGPFALYSGRVEGDNGCEEMLEYFDSYASVDGDTSLVLMGAKLIKIPEPGYLRHAGIVPDRDRMIAYEAADVTLAPAANDLLAEPVLESLAVGTPVLASAANPAAVEHCRRANGGLYYGSREEFVEALRQLTGNPRLRERLGANGRQYMKTHYRWEAVLGRFERLLGRVKSRG